MKRDKELSRAILLFISNYEQAFVASLDKIILEDQDKYSPKLIAHHTGWLIDGGFLKGINVTGSGQEYPEWLNIELTSRGHDYVDIIEDDDTWESIKKQKRERTIQLIIEGDFVAGDKIGDDKIEGNKIAGNQS